MLTKQTGAKKYVSSKTNVCHICKFNCELDCHKLLKTSSKYLIGHLGVKIVLINVEQNIMN